MRSSRWTKTEWARGAHAAVMLGVASDAGVPRTTLVVAACACARLVLVRQPPYEDRPRRAIEVAEAWADGPGTGADVVRAMHAVRTCADQQDGAAGAAAGAAECAADVVFGKRPGHVAYLVATTVFYAAARAIGGEGSHLATAIGVAARVEAQRKMTDVVRAHIPWATLAEAYARGRA